MLPIATHSGALDGDTFRLGFHILCNQEVESHVANEKRNAIQYMTASRVMMINSLQAYKLLGHCVVDACVNH